MSQTALYIDYIDIVSKQTMHLPLSILKRPTNEREYKKVEKWLNRLIDEVKDNEKHPLAEAMQIMGDNLELYDTEYHPAIGEGLTDIEKVKYLMIQYGLKQQDLASIFGGQANVSRFLNGERQLSKHQVEGLKNYFKISADYFI